jgi:hypothetical protein
VQFTNAFLASVIVAAVANAAVSATVIVVNTEAHGVCAMMSCEDLRPCAPLTIIKECGLPTATIRDFDHALIYLVMIPLLLVTAMFVFRKYYLKRKDFYVVR